jgi:hypothetical protein
MLPKRSPEAVNQTKTSQYSRQRKQKTKGPTMTQKTKDYYNCKNKLRLDRMMVIFVLC